MSYVDDRKWSDRFIPVIRQVVGPHLLVPAPLERDINEASDLIILRARDMTIACRVRGRKKDYSEDYPWDVTFRSARDNGTKTELQKIREGWADWMFYGHAHPDGYSFVRWLLLDLHVWRSEAIKAGFASWLGKSSVHGHILRSHSNGDGTHLISCDIRRFPPELVIASSHTVEAEEEEPV